MDKELEAYLAGQSALQREGLEALHNIIEGVWKKTSPEFVSREVFHDPCEVLSSMVSLTFNIFTSCYGENNAEKLLEGIKQQFNKSEKPVIH